MSILRIRHSNLVRCLLTIAVVLVIAQIFIPTDALARVNDHIQQNPNNDFGGGDGGPDEPGPGKSLISQFWDSLWLVLLIDRIMALANGGIPR